MDGQLVLIEPTSIVAMSQSEAREKTDQIKAGLAEARRLLLEMYEREGWASLGYSSWREYGQAEFGYEERHIYRLMEAARVERAICPIGQMEQLIRESHLRPLTSLEPEQQRDAWVQVLEENPDGHITGAKVQEVVDRMQGKPEFGDLVRGPIGNYREKNGVKRCEKCGQLWAADLDYCPYCNISQEARVLHIQQERQRPQNVSDRPDYDGDEWHTPPEYIGAAREVMGCIDLDPASNETAQAEIQAERWFTKQDDGLQHHWFGHVWMNPPYSMPKIEQFVDKLIGEFDSGNVEEAVIVVNNSSDTRWFHSLLDRFPACFMRGRVQFWHPNYETFATRQGQTFFYLGDCPDKFRKVFSKFGIVVGKL